MDQPCFDKLVCEYGVPEERVQILPQFVDLARFQSRPALPATPSRAVILCNYTTDNEHLAAVREAAALSGVTLDALAEAWTHSAEPEKLLREYDIVLPRAERLSRRWRWALR